MYAAATLASVALMAVPVAVIQDVSQSEHLAKRLGALMQSQKLDALLASETGAGDRFVAALFFPGQMLVVSARYAQPVLLRERLLNREYRDIYLQLQGAGEAKDKLFVQDLGVDGLHLLRAPQRPVDVIYQAATVRTLLDGEWAKQGISEQEYRQRFQAVDGRYAVLLRALLKEAKAPTQN
jgi:hypothetical protein